MKKQICTKNSPLQGIAVSYMLFTPFVLLVLIGIYPGEAYAFSLGQLQILNKPHERFQATTTVKLSPQEKITSVKVGEQSDYDFLQLPYNPAVKTITVQLKEQDGKHLFWLQSIYPLTTYEFYVLLRVSSNLQTYSPFFRVRAPLAVETKAVNNANKHSEEISLQNNPPTIRQQPTTKNKLYGPIQGKDTLTQIARIVKPSPSVSIFQVMVALWKQNPDKFIRNNMNGLIAGKKLIIPSEEEIAQVNDQAARTLKRDHFLAWNKKAEEKIKIPREVPPLLRPKSLIVLSSPAPQKEGSQSTDFDKPSNTAKPKIRPRESDPSQDGTMKMIAEQLRTITNVLEKNQDHQARFDQRLSALENSNGEWGQLNNRVNQLEISHQSIHHFVREFKEYKEFIEKKWIILGGVGMAGFGLVIGFSLLWLLRRWNIKLPNIRFFS